MGVTPPHTEIDAYIKVADTVADLNSPSTMSYGPYLSSPVDLVAKGVPKGQYVRVDVRAAVHRRDERPHADVVPAGLGLQWRDQLAERRLGPKTETLQAGRAELVRRLTALAPKQKLDAMLEEVDGRALVRSVPAEDVYATIVDVGLADAPEVVQLATPEQFRTFVDLATWSRDRMDPLEVLALAAGRARRRRRRLPRQAEDARPRGARAALQEGGGDSRPRRRPRRRGAGHYRSRSPEGRYLIELVGLEGVELAALRRLIHDMMGDNAFEFGRFLESVRWELPSELEETAHQFRRARLEDLGFPPMEEAAKLFAWVDPASVAPKDAKAGQALAAQTGSGALFVEAAFRGLDAHERNVMEAEVRYLVNSALVAEGAEPGDPQALRRVSEQARDWLNLGLEHLSGGEPERASDAVRDQTLQRVFQVGFSLTLKLKRQVEKLALEPNARFGETWLALEQETQALLALMRKRPMKALKVPGAEPVPFRFKRELAESEAMLQRVRAQRTVLMGLLEPTPAEVVARFGVKLSELTPQRLLAAAVAWAEVDGAAQARPFARGRLVELCSRLFTGTPGAEALSPRAGERAIAALAGPGRDANEVKAMVDRVLQAMLNDFGRTWLRDLRVEAARLIALPVEGELPP